MVDANGNKCLLIKFIPYYDYENEIWLPSSIDVTDEFWGTKECEWSLVEEFDDFQQSFWFSYDDYEVYRPWQIKKKFYTKRTRLTEKILVDAGYYRVIGKTFKWAHTWFFNTLRLKKLETYFLKIGENEQEEQFRKFARMADVHNEVILIAHWLQLDLAIKWCDEHNIQYLLDIPNGYQKEYPEDALKSCAEKIRYAARTEMFMPPFDFLNGLNDNSIFIHDYYS